MKRAILLTYKFNYKNYFFKTLNKRRTNKAIKNARTINAKTILNNRNNSN